MKIIKGCPICREDVFGTKETGYYCKHCNLLFNKRQINFSETKKLLKKNIQEHFKDYEGVSKNQDNNTSTQYEIKNDNKKNSFHYEKESKAKIPKRTELTKTERKELASIRGISSVKSLRKIDGYEEDEKPLILKFIDEHLKKFQEHKEVIRKRTINKKNINNKKKKKKVN